MESTVTDCTNEPIPRSKAYNEKEILNENHVKIKDTIYYKRQYNDGSVELVRYDYRSVKWVFLLFKG